MDLRYNMIHWVHRSTRGWSYGNVVVDPRTGEILKGRVTLDSLRARQDALIGVGLTAGGDGRDHCGAGSLPPWSTWPISTRPHSRARWFWLESASSPRMRWVTPSGSPTTSPQVREGGTR